MKYSWATQTNESGTKSNFSLVAGQIDTLIGLHENLLASPTYENWQAMLQAASKSDQLPAATHIEDYFTKKPAYPPTGGYVMQVYLYGLFVSYLSNAINGLATIAANPSNATSAIVSPGAPSYDQSGFQAQFQNGQPGPGNWAPGYQVQYAVTFFLGNNPTSPEYESAIENWSQAISSETSYYPLVISIQVDPTGLAFGRKIYRQFQNQAAEYVGCIPDNISTSYQDTSN